MAGPESLSLLAKDKYSVVHTLRNELADQGWNVPVDLIRNGWPDAEEINPPSIWVLMDLSRTAPWELGVHGKERETFIYIYATNDSERDALAEAICDIVRDIIPIYDWVTGSETSPSVVEYFNTEGDVEFRPIRAPTTAPKEEQWRAVVQATLTRQDA
jgi:hypothetical protein